MSETERRAGDSTEAEVLRADRDYARQELEQTVAELTHAVDMPARSKEKVQQAADAVKQEAARVEEAAVIAKDKAVQQATETADQVKARAGQLADKVPEPVQEQGRRATELARRQPVPLAALIALLGALIAWWILHRRQQ